MRSALSLALLLVILAGCATSDVPRDPLFGFCPSWENGPGQVAQEADVAGDGAVARAVLAPADGNFSLHGHVLDVVHLQIDAFNLTGGTLSLRAYILRNGTEERHNLRDLRTPTPETVAIVVFPAGAKEKGHEFEVHLSPLDQNHPTQAAPVLFEWTLEGNASAHVEYRATFGYKVCGAVL